MWSVCYCTRPEDKIWHKLCRGKRLGISFTLYFLTGDEYIKKEIIFWFNSDLSIDGGFCLKVSPWDFLYSAICVIGLSLAAGGILFVGLANFLIQNLGAYGYLTNVAILVTVYGVLSGFLLRFLLMVRPIGQGDLNSEGADFAYWKLLTIIHYFGLRALFLFNLEPAMPLIGRLFGAKIGKNVAIGGILDSPFLIEIGDLCILGRGSIISGNVSLSGRTNVGPVKIGPGSTIGVYSLVMPHTTIGARVTIAPHSVVVSGTNIPDGEVWKGNPARKWQ